jgi:hypothetical protein
VYFLGGGGTDLVSRSIGMVPVFADRFAVPEYESPRNAYPRQVRQKKFGFAVYRLTDDSDGPVSFEMNIGGFDDLNVVRFYAKEQMGATTFRWSGRSSFISVPANDRARQVTLWLSDGGRPPNAPPARVSVYLDDGLLGTVLVAQGFTPYSFAIPPRAAVVRADPDEAALVRLVTDTWNPRRLLRSSDDRDLGVMVSRIEIK